MGQAVVRGMVIRRRNRRMTIVDQAKAFAIILHIISGGSTVADIVYGDPSYPIVQG